MYLFTGLSLDHFIPPDLKNSTLEIMNGEVILELNDQNKNLSLKPGDIFTVCHCYLNSFPLLKIYRGVCVCGCLKVTFTHQQLLLATFLFQGIICVFHTVIFLACCGQVEWPYQLTESSWCPFHRD